MSFINLFGIILWRPGVPWETGGGETIERLTMTPGPVTELCKNNPILLSFFSSFLLLKTEDPGTVWGITCCINNALTQQNWLKYFWLYELTFTSCPAPILFQHWQWHSAYLIGEYLLRISTGMAYKYLEYPDADINLCYSFYVTI